MEVPSAQQWQQLKEEIKDLYSRRPLKDVRAILEQRYGFRATLIKMIDRMFKSRLSAWGFSRNSQDREYQTCARLNKIRKQSGKPDSVFIINGNKRSLRDLRKYIKGRKMTEDAFLALAEQHVSEEQLNEEQNVRAAVPERPKEKDPAFSWDQSERSSMGSTLTGLELRRPKMGELERNFHFSDEYPSPVATSLTLPDVRSNILPMYIATRHFDAVADCCSDENAIELRTAVKLGLKVGNVRREFDLANGRKFSSIGQAETTCSFVLGQKGEEQKVTFNVFQTLAAPVIFGREFLEQTQTLSKHTDRLKPRQARGDGMLRIMHFNRQHRRLRCSLNGLEVFAAPDTGADMNLVSPAFAWKARAAGCEMAREDLKVQFADGSFDTVTESFTADFSIPAGNAFGTPTTFYVLEGLTSEVLVGQDLLFELDIFRRHSDSFFDFPRSPPASSLNIIKWLTKRESGLLKILRSAPKDNTIANQQNPVDSSLASMTFHAGLEAAEARELHRQENAGANIAQLPDQWRAAAHHRERERVAEYDREKAKCLTKHRERLRAQQAQGKSGGCPICPP